MTTIVEQKPLQSTAEQLIPSPKNVHVRMHSKACKFSGDIFKLLKQKR